MGRPGQVVGSTHLASPERVSGQGRRAACCRAWMLPFTTEYDPANPLLHRSVHLEATDAKGRPITVDGDVVSICPTKIPRSDGVTFVNEGIARFTTVGQEGDVHLGYGIAEHWHAVPR